MSLLAIIERAIQLYRHGLGSCAIGCTDGHVTTWDFPLLTDRRPTMFSKKST
jgi:hypothetical protein